jgi:hypothetical protein
MRSNQLLRFVTLVAPVGAVMAIAACSSLTGGGSSAIDPDAATVLKAMSDKLAAAQQFTFKGTRTVDPALAQGGRDVKLNARLQGAVARPNKISASAADSRSTRRFIYDGENVTLYNPDANHYATVPGGSDIDKTIDKIVENWNFHPAMADLLVSDPYASLSKRATSGKLVGTEKVRGINCHHITVTQEALDWEAWISASDHLLRRFVITFKGVEGSPKVRVEITEWDLDPTLSASQFTFTPPKGAQKIEMVPAGS